MKWITRSQVHVHRVACPWVITRFIDSDAQFLFVPKSQVLRIAKKEEAIAVGYIRYPDDHANIKAQFEVYDALYAWCIDVAGNSSQERHVKRKYAGT